MYTEVISALTSMHLFLHVLEPTINLIEDEDDFEMTNQILVQKRTDRREAAYTCRTSG